MTSKERMMCALNKGKPDRMPVDEGIKGELPDEKIRRAERNPS